MFKRTVLLLGLLAGMLGGLPFGTPTPVQAHNTVLVLEADGLQASTVQAILKEAAPQFGINMGQAMSAYRHQELTIHTLVGLVEAYEVEYGGMCILILIEDEL